MRERLLAVHMLARVNARHRSDCVNMVGRADRYGIDLLAFLVEHLAEVFVSLRLRVRCECAGRPNLIHVAERDDIRPELAERRDVGATHRTHTNTSDVYLFAR